MKIASKSEILELLSMPYTEFCKTVMKEAKEIYRSNGNVLKASGMLGYSNVCKNHCLYCGMSAGCKIPRYRVEPEEAIQSMEAAKESGLRRIFLISGEDPNYQFEKILEMVRGAKKLGMHVSLATGEFEREQYKQLRDAGAEVAGGGGICRICGHDRLRAELLYLYLEFHLCNRCPRFAEAPFPDYKAWL